MTADASAEIDELLGAVYSVPFPGPTYDPAIVEIAAIFTMYRGAARRPEYVADEKRPNPYATERKDAMKRLDEIRIDKRRLALATPLPSNAGGIVSLGTPTSDGSSYFLVNPDTGTGGFADGAY